MQRDLTDTHSGMTSKRQQLDPALMKTFALRTLNSASLEIMLHTQTDAMASESSTT